MAGTNRATVKTNKNHKLAVAVGRARAVVEGSISRRLETQKAV